MNATYTISSELDTNEMQDLRTAARDGNAIAELTDLELAFVGGGTGDVCF